MAKVAKPRDALKGVIAATGSLRKKLSVVTNRTLTGVDIHVSEQRGNFGGSAVAKRLTIVIIADTAEHAFQHAKELEDQGCVCTSSGETEVTCNCDDAH